MKIGLLIAMIVTCLSVFSAYGQTQTFGEVKLKTRYMAYACGECYTQYQVVKILSTGKPKKEFKYLLGKDIYIEFTKDMVEEIDKKKLECQTCFFYEVNGSLIKKDTTFTLIAQEYKMYERYKGCCDYLKKLLKQGREAK